MTLIFSGNNFKYELEGIMKLFIPAQLFKHVYTESYEAVDDDFVFLRRVKYKQKTLLYAYCKMGEETAHKSKIISNQVLDYENQCELILSGLLYVIMTKLTGVEARWGIITGIRPVKRVNTFISQGKSKEEIYHILKNDYLVSDEKCDIAYLTAKTQEDIINQLPSNTFSLYISIPFCPTRCSYCSFVSQSIESCENLIPEYINNLCEEITYTSEIVKRLGLALNTVYFGGGTPTTLSASQLELIMDTIEQCFDISEVMEYTVEAGRPDTITEEKLLTLKKKGCTRLSVNPQTLNDDVLKAIGRNHNSQQFFDSFSKAREIGFDCINTDIIAGLPTDTIESFKNTVENLLLLSPENITVHTLSIKRAANLNQSSDKQSVLNNPAKEMVEYATSRLIESGYKPYYLYRQKNMLENLENIGWSKTGKESLYNIYIMEEIQTILALGAGGSTKLVNPNNYKVERVYNYKFPLEYNKHFDIMLSKKNEIEEFYAKKE